MPSQAGQWDEEAQGTAALTAVHGGINRQKAAQPLRHRVVFTGGDTGAQSARRAQRGGDIPVSYTHLDVYKRQILTCAHVVSGASNITVTIGDTDYPATVVGEDGLKR